MTAASTSVKYYHSAMTGAPAIGITAGALIAVLDACLKDGFNLKTVDTLVVASGIATANISTGVGAFEVDTVALISGASPSGLNGEKRILSVGANSFTFDATGISNQTATGTISAKLAPAGWDKPYSGTNLAVYRSADVTSTKMLMRVDDTGTTNARVVGYESMTDVNTGLGAFPTSVQQSGGMYWPKANATNKAWTLIADSKTFWFWTHANATLGSVGLSGLTLGFGDFTPVKSGDAYAATLLGALSDVSTLGSQSVYDGGYSQTSASLSSQGTVVPRSFTGVGGSIPVARVSESFMPSAGNVSGGVTSLANYPNGADNSLLLSKMLVIEATPALRGRLRGLLFVAQMAHAAFNWRDKVDGQGTLSGRKLLAIKTSAPVGGSSGGLLFFDIFGPWE